MTDVRIIPLADAEAWQAELALAGRPTQSWHYASALALDGLTLDGLTLDGLAPALAVARAGGATLRFCFLERSWRDSRDIATVLGLSGASLDGDSVEPWQAWREFARQRGWVAGYLQLAHDVQALPPGPLDRIHAGNAIFLLGLEGDDPMQSASEILRRKVRRAQRAGVQAVDDPAALADALVHWYPRTMQRLGAGPAYAHTEATLRAFASLPGAVVVGAARHGVVESVSVFACAGARAEFLCNACSEDGREWSAWVFAEAIARMRARGLRELDLGGGVAPGDGLYRFKERFHGRALPLRSLHQVYDDARYRQLCADAGAADGEESYFPAYRAPAMSARRLSAD